MLQNLGCSVYVWIQQDNMNGVEKHFSDFGGRDHNYDQSALQQIAKITWNQEIFLCISKVQKVKTIVFST